MTKTFALESNGFLEKTACYINGQQVGGLKEVFINIEEEGIFDAIIQYEAKDKQVYTCQIFKDSLQNIKIVEPSFTEDEANQLALLEIESDGTVDNTAVFYNNEELTGVVSLFIHIKAIAGNKGIQSLFSKPINNEQVIFKTEIIFRNEDNTLSSESIF